MAQSTHEVDDDESVLGRMRAASTVGYAGVIELLPCGKIVRKSINLKGPIYWQSMHRLELQREVDTYRHLPPHPRLLPMLGSNKDGDDPSIDLAYMPNGSLKAYLRRYSEMITASLRAQWALQTAQGVAMLHSHSVIHADLKPANIVLDDALGVRIIDFAGCSLLGKAPYILETGAFYLPGDFRDEGIGCTVKSDLFALGSCIFQIVTGNKPHEGLEDKAIEDKFEEQVFPDLGEMMFAEVIRKCWFCEFDAADEVLLALSVEARVALGDPDFPSSVLGERVTVSQDNN